MAPRGHSGRLLLGALTWAARGEGPELAPLIRCVRSWPRLLDQAVRSALLETLADAVATSRAEDALPGFVRAQLREVREIAAASNMLLLTETARLQALLASRKIRSVALKGTALIAASYPRLGARHVADLDLLVPLARLDDACAVLESEMAESYRLLDHAGRHARAPAHVAPVRTRTGVWCELHFAVLGDATGTLTELVLADARSIAVPGGRTVSIPSSVHSAAVAALHVFAGHSGDPLHLPRLVADLEALDATGGLDWPAIQECAGQAGATHVAAARALLESARAGDDCAVFPGAAEVLAAHLVRPFVRRALASPAAAVRAFVPSRRFMAARYAVPESSPRLLLYYVARPFLAIRDRLRR